MYIATGTMTAFTLIIFVIGVRIALSDHQKGEKGATVPSIVLLVCSVAIAGGAVLVFRVERPLATSRVDRDTGMPCTAQLLGMKDRSARVNGNDVVEWRIRVQISGKAPYPAVSTAAVPSHVLSGSTTDSASFRCRADRDDLKRVEVLWRERVG